MGKRDSRRHSTTSFSSENVVVAKTSYEMLDYFAIKTWFNLVQKDNRANFPSEKKYDEAFQDVFFQEYGKTTSSEISFSRRRSAPAFS